jgi:hypothetical protein
MLKSAAEPQTVALPHRSGTESVSACRVGEIADLVKSLIYEPVSSSANDLPVGGRGQRVTGKRRSWWRGHVKQDVGEANTARQQRTTESRHRHTLRMYSAVPPVG